jgi:nucleotide-binding universal stress UspA family protein
MAGITVGFDGSRGAQRALAWAMREAAYWRMPMTVLTVHRVGVSSWTGSSIVRPADDPYLAQARRVARDAVAKAAADLGQPSTAGITVHAVSGLPGHELIGASEDADLVVVGARGTSPITRLLVGSVSNEVLRRARCPVVVVPDAR